MDFNKISKQQRDQEESMRLAKATVDNLKELQKLYKESKVELTEYLQSSRVLLENTIESFENAVDAQDKEININVDVDTTQIEESIVPYFSQFKNMLTEIQRACSSIQVNVEQPDAPVVNIEAPEIDTTELERIIKEDFLSMIEGFYVLLEPVKDLDPTTMDFRLKRIIELLEKLLNKPMGSVVTGGGGGGGTYIPLIDGKVPITGNITATSGVLDSFGVNDIDKPNGYYGLEDPDGVWCILKKTDVLVSYATASVNGAVTSYTDAWTNKLTLNYERFSTAF